MPPPAGEPQFRLLFSASGRLCVRGPGMLLAAGLGCLAALPLGAQPATGAAALDPAGPATGALCPPATAAPQLPAIDDTRPRLSADRVTTTADERLQASGNATILRGGQRIGAARIEVDRSGERAAASGDVTFDTADYALRAEQATFDGEQAVFDSATWRQRSTGMRGGAARIERDGEARTTLHEASITACPPEQPDWQVSASSIALDHTTQQGTARGAVLRFKGVPLLYSPWFRFPIGDARQSGFLAPEVSYSNSAGGELALPWYWNIAPQADATFTPRIMSRRGTQLRNELRLLTEQGRWRLDAEYLDDREFGDERSFGRLRHSGRLGDRWTTYLDASSASDKDYFDDLGNSLSVASLTHLERRGDLVYYADTFSLRTTVQSYQTLDEDIAAGSRPYQRLPQLLLSTVQPDSEHFDYGLRAEAVQFERRDSLTGQRLDLAPYLGTPTGGAAWFFNPKLTLRHTQYALDNAAAGEDDTLARSLPVLSLDGGLFFERDAGASLQTLEPRFYYLYVPFEEQDDLPVFDTGQYTFSFAQLFRDNRFSGPDRLGDAEQISLALSSRLLDPASGAEQFSIGVGQILYLRDRKVVLPGADVETRDTSDAIIEAAAALNPDWSLSGALQFNPETEQNDRGVLQLRYTRSQRYLASLAYRYRREQQEQVDASVRWQLDSAWSVVGRWHQSLPDNELLESLAGFEYETCCWLLRSVARERIGEEGERNERSIYLQLALKGLTSIGRETGSLLEHGILGYRRSAGYE